MNFILKITILLMSLFKRRKKRSNCLAIVGNHHWELFGNLKGKIVSKVNKLTNQDKEINFFQINSTTMTVFVFFL